MDVRLFNQHQEIHKFLKDAKRVSFWTFVQLFVLVSVFDTMIKLFIYFVWLRLQQQQLLHR